MITCSLFQKGALRSAKSLYNSKLFSKITEIYEAYGFALDHALYHTDLEDEDFGL